MHIRLQLGQPKTINQSINQSSTISGFWRSQTLLNVIPVSTIFSNGKAWCTCMQIIATDVNFIHRENARSQRESLKAQRRFVISEAL